MEISPTWDLFILVFFSIIVAYSFIIGRNATLKIIIATYIAILTADGLGNVFESVLLAPDAMIQIFTAADSYSLIVLKILIFVLTIVVIAIRGGFFVEIGREHSVLMGLATTAAFGFLSAGLIVSTILVYMSGGSFLLPVAAGSGGGLDITTTSYLAATMTDNYNLWFALPALAFVVASFVGTEQEAAHGSEE